MKDRLKHLAKEIGKRLIKAWKWLFVVLVDLIKDVIQDRYTSGINAYLDSHRRGFFGYIRPLLDWVLSTPLGVSIIVLCAVVCAVIVHAAIDEARKVRSKEASIAPPADDPKLEERLPTHRSEAGETKLALNAEWKELAARFEKLPSGIRADYQIDRKDQATTYDSWMIIGDNHRSCETLCKYAGILLLNSPNALKHASDVTQQQSNPIWRWLYFLKDHGAARSNGLPPTSDDGTIYLLGSISDLAPSSARMCIECAAQELAISLPAKHGAEVPQSEESVSADDPQVVINVSGERLQWNAKDEFPKERPIYLQNLGRNPAYRVQIQPVSLTYTKATAIFREVTPLAPQMPVPIRPKLEFKLREELMGVSEFEVLMQVEWPCEAGFDKELVVPMQITYEDHRKRKFRTDLKFGYCFSGGSRTFDFQFTRLS
jgi:hypothetical protein